MLMDFQIDSHHAATAQIMADAPHTSQGRNSATHEIRTFELPSAIWKAMFACYAIFFSALFVATGRGASAIFAFVVSVGYAVVYFGTASIINRISAPERMDLPKLEASVGMQTHTGWMNNAAVNAQILIVPISLVMFATSFAIIRALV